MINKIILILSFIFLSVKATVCLGNSTSYYLYTSGSNYSYLIIAQWWPFGAGDHHPRIYKSELNQSNDTLYLNYYYHLAGSWPALGSVSIDTVSLGLLMPNIHVIHATAFTADSADTASITYYLDTSILISALSLYQAVDNFDKFKLHPNPTQNKIYFQLPPLLKPRKITLMDSYGRVIKQLPYTGQNDMDMSDVTNGIYLLQFQGEQETITREVIKQQ